MISRPPPVPPEAFDEILEELKRQPISTNKYRTKAGSGRSQTFGIVNRRSLPPDYSRQNWWRPYLYHLCYEFGKKYVPFSFNSITVNQNYRATAHYDKHNKGESYLVAFGSYEGGDLKLLDTDASGSYDIWCKPLVADFSKILHEVDAFTGDRFSLVFYTFDTPRLPHLPPWELKEEGGKWFFYRDGKKVTREGGLPHPLKKESSLKIERGVKTVRFDQ